MPQVLNRHALGNRVPDGAVYVGRPSRWGNPFSVKEYGRTLAIALYREMVTGCWNPRLLAHVSDTEFQHATALRDAWLKRIGGHPMELVHELRGKDLVCWCAPDRCHADVLLELANKEA